MIEPSVLLAFTLLNMTFALLPGPDVLCILSSAITRGARAGYLVCLGIAAACCVHVLCATLGLTAILAAVPAAFLTVKLLGALYLVTIGWQLIRHPRTLASGTAATRMGSPFAQGFVSNLLNPKIAVFFLAILPQFIRPGRGGPGLQALELGLVSIVSGTAVNVVTATLGAQAGRFLASRHALLRRLQQASGALLVGLAARVAAD